MGIARAVKKVMNKTRKAAKKRYTNKAGGTKFNAMAKDVMWLKSVLNPEKKRSEVTVENQAVGQVNLNDDGGYLIDTTPTPNQGVTYNTRNGASIKLHSSVYHFQFTQSVGTIAQIKGVIEIWAVKGDSYAGFNFRTEHWLPNPFTTVRDMNCQINPDNFMKAKCVARRYFTVKSDQTSSVKELTDVKMNILYNKGKGHHVRFNKDTTTIENGQLFLIIRTNRGNISGLAPSSLNVPDVNINTGVLMQFNKVDYFYDN